MEILNIQVINILIFTNYITKIKDIIPQQSQNIMDHLGRKKLLQLIVHIVSKIKVIKFLFLILD